MYEELTDILRELPQGEYGHWIMEHENDGRNIFKSDKIFDLRRLPAILAKLKMFIGIERYRFIMEKIRQVDVSLDEDFQKTYENFYTLGRYPKEFRRNYFAYMERGNEIKPSFEATLSYFL